MLISCLVSLQLFACDESSQCSGCQPMEHSCDGSVKKCKSISNYRFDLASQGSLARLRGTSVNTFNKNASPDYVRSDFSQLSVEQVKRCLEIVHNAKMIGNEYHYIYYLPNEFTQFINSYAKKILGEDMTAGPEVYVNRFQENSDIGYKIRHQFALLAKIFDGWRQASSCWIQYQGVEDFAKNRYNVSLVKE